MENEKISKFHIARRELTIKMISLCYSQKEVFFVLDVGCGEGLVTNEIANKFQNAKIYAFDISFISIFNAKKSRKNIIYFIADVQKLPLKFNIVNMAILNNIIEHLECPVSILKEIYKYLKSEGFLIISTPNRYHLYNILNVIIGKPTKLMNSEHITEYTIGQIKEILSKTGFNLVKIEPMNVQKEIISLKSWFIIKILKPMIKSYLKLAKSYHLLEPTLFYIAKK